MHRVILISILLLCTTAILGQPAQEWRVWVKTSPCSGRHDWISVAKENPTSYGLSYFELANVIFPQTPCTTFACTFEDATKVANGLKAMDEFFDYCCRDYSVWENTSTKAKSVVVGKFGTAGMGWILLKADLCCEEAEALAGIPNACSGHDQVACWPGSYAAYNPQTQRTECYCNPGLVWNANKTACIPGIPDCPNIYANSETLWDAVSQQYLCYCKTGYVWNETKTACVLPIPDCNYFYKNSVPVWDEATKQYLCNCLQGFVWNQTRTECIVNSIPDCNTFYKNSYAAWDATSNQYLCYCPTGYEWNAARTECIKVNAQQDEPVVNPQQKKQGECNIQYKSGANEAEQYTIDVKRNFGSLNFSYDTYSVKDRIHIYYGGIKIFDSGCVGASGSQTLTLNGISSVFTIIVDPRCDMDTSDTSWNFTLGCPN